MAERTRTILYTGKGGVGKTSVAAATALRCARDGLKTLVMSTDPAHSLSDSLQVPLGGRPVEVEPNLWGQQIEANAEMERHWSSVRDWLSELLADRGVDAIAAEELTVPPGMDELFSLIELKRHSESGEWDLIVVDCAPTGETLRLLSFPEVARWWLEKVFPWEKRLVSVARPFAKTLLDIPLPNSSVYDDVERLVENLVAMSDILRDREFCSIRLVMTPDRMVISEAMRLFTYLNLYGYLTDAVVVNRVFPPEVDGGYFESWRERQQEELAFVNSGFAPMPVLTAPFFEQEVVGDAMLVRLADSLFDGSPSARMFDVLIQELTINNGNAQLNLALPFAEKGEVSLKKVGLEVVIKVGNQKRTIMLPSSLAAYRPHGAKFDDGNLRVEFTRDE